MYPLIIPDFIDAVTVKEIYTWAVENEHLFGKYDGSFWGGRSLHSDCMPINIKNIIASAFYNVIDIIGDSGLQPELLDITRWPPGYELHPHADAEEPNGKQHIYWWRKFGAIIYLNSNFIGGELYYPNLNITVKPQPGMLAVHPGTLKYLHGVKSVAGNTRYTLTSFFK